jgi:NADH dehydrogenase FAD-containing subunit
VVGAPRIDAAYELLINAVGWLKKRQLLDLCPITFITPESELFQSSRSAFVAREAKKAFHDISIEVITALSIRKVDPTELILSDGRLVPFSVAFLVPSFLGIEAMRACPKIADTRGFVRVNEFFQSPVYPEVFAAGAAVATDEHDKTPRLIESSARCVAQNIAALISGTPMHNAGLASTHGASEGDPHTAWIGPGLTCHHYLVEQTRTGSIPPP